MTDDVIESPTDGATPLPWVGAPLARALAATRAHAVLLQGPSGVGQFETASALAAAWLCEDDAVPRLQRPCGRCAGCRLIAARSHPDLLVLLPEALREGLGWARAGDGEDGGEKASKAKPSQEIKVDAVRAAVAFASTTSARGRAKAIVVHPAERMNAVAANALLKTLEEPPGAARFVLSSAASDRLLPTIRSRCVAVALPLPPHEAAVAWLAGHGVADAAVLLAACGGRPSEALAWQRLGLDAAFCRGVPRRAAAGDSAAFRPWPLPIVVDLLHKLCHDALCVACGAPPRYYAAADVPRAAFSALLDWSRALGRIAARAEHPWNADLAVESLVQQAAQALKTARSRAPGKPTGSLNSAA